jgi:hypothetical protein
MSDVRDRVKNGLDGDVSEAPLMTNRGPANSTRHIGRSNRDQVRTVFIELAYLKTPGGYQAFF